MEIKIKLIDPALGLPEYKTKGAVAFDLMSREDLTINPGEVGYAPLNICVEPPEGHMLMLAARSSLHKRGLMLANGVAIGDQDFAGNEDEYKAVLLNFSKEPVTVKRGERIVQGLFKPIVKAVWRAVDDMEQESRGGFGSTGIV
jgi:dUTP pyrophosphatase